MDAALRQLPPRAAGRRPVTGDAPGPGRGRGGPGLHQLLVRRRGAARQRQRLARRGGPAPDLGLHRPRPRQRRRQLPAADRRPREQPGLPRLPDGLHPGPRRPGPDRLTVLRGRPPARRGPGHGHLLGIPHRHLRGDAAAVEPAAPRSRGRRRGRATGHRHRPADAAGERDEHGAAGCGARLHPAAALGQPMGIRLPRRRQHRLLLGRWHGCRDGIAVCGHRPGLGHPDERAAGGGRPGAQRLRHLRHARQRLRADRVGVGARRLMA